MVSRLQRKRRKARNRGIDLRQQVVLRSPGVQQNRKRDRIVPFQANIRWPKPRAGVDADREPSGIDRLERRAQRVQHKNRYLDQGFINMQSRNPRVLGSNRHSAPSGNESRTKQPNSCVPPHRPDPDPRHVLSILHGSSVSVTWKKPWLCYSVVLGRCEGVLHKGSCGTLRLRNERIYFLFTFLFVAYSSLRVTPCNSGLSLFGPALPFQPRLQGEPDPSLRKRNVPLAAPVYTRRLTRYTQSLGPYSKTPSLGLRFFADGLHENNVRLKLRTFKCRDAHVPSCTKEVIHETQRSSVPVHPCNGRCGNAGNVRGRPGWKYPERHVL